MDELSIGSSAIEYERGGPNSKMGILGIGTQMGTLRENFILLALSR